MTIGRIPSVEGGIQPTIVDAKGDLIAATAADTVNRLAVGSNDQVLVADSSASTGLAWKSYATPFAAGKNKVINGDFSINQRNVTTTTSNGDFLFDRFRLGRGAGGTVTFSSQAFTAGTAPVAGYEATNFARLVTVSQSAAGDYAAIRYAAEDVRTYANSTITLSVWAKGASGGEKFNFALEQTFGSGGSSAVVTKTAVQTVTSSWARYSVTVTVPSVSGKTIGTGSSLLIWMFTSGGSSLSSYTDIGNANATVDFWGLQAEAGSVATPFQTATGTLQGELAACQRYYQVHNRNGQVSIGAAYSTTQAFASFAFVQTMRTAPTITLATAGQTTGRVSFLKNDATYPATTGSHTAGNITVSGFEMAGASYSASSFAVGNASLVYANGATDIYTASAEL